MSQHSLFSSPLDPTLSPLSSSSLLASPEWAHGLAPPVPVGPTASAVAVRMGWMSVALAAKFRECGNVSPIQRRADGDDTAVLGLTWLDEQQGIFARAGGDIHGVADLRGKRLGLPLRDSLTSAVALRGLLTGLELGGVRARQVELVDSSAAVGPDQWRDSGPDLPDLVDESPELAALLSGGVDAVFLRSAAAIEAAADGRLRRVLDLNQHPDPLVRLNHGTLRALTVRRSFLHAYPNAVVQYLALLLRTATWAEHHHDAVVGVLSSSPRDPAGRDLLAVHGPDLHRALAPSLDEKLVRALERQKDFLRDWKFLTADFSVTNWIVGDPLAAARELARRQPPLIDDGLPFTPYPTTRPSSDRAGQEALPTGW
jgi:sulfonate transport system substrate-binding protein